MNFGKLHTHRTIFGKKNTNALRPWCAASFIPKRKNTRNLKYPVFFVDLDKQEQFLCWNDRGTTLFGIKKPDFTNFRWTFLGINETTHHGRRVHITNLGKYCDAYEASQTSFSIKKKHSHFVKSHACWCHVDSRHRGQHSCSSGMLLIPLPCAPALRV